MTGTADALVLDLVEWVAATQRHADNGRKAGPIHDDRRLGDGPH